MVVAAHNRNITMRQFQKLLLALAFGSLAMQSCNTDVRHEEVIQEKGLLRLAAPAANIGLNYDSLAVQINDKDNTPVVQLAKASDIPAAGLEIKPGQYTFTATPTNKRVPLFEKPIYSGSSTFSVSAANVSTLNLALKQVNFGLGISYSDKFKKTCTGYSCTVSSPDGSLTFQPNEERLGYFYRGPLVVTISYTDEKGEKKEYKHQIASSSASLAPGSKLLLNIKLPYEEGGESYTGYYQNASGKVGIALKKALSSIITTGYKEQSYAALFSAYAKGDIRTDKTGAIWDIYSDIPSGTPPYYFQPNQDECGSYKNEGDCYNREHCIPQSWFKSQSPMVSDYLHILPTDGKVNGMRSNYPFGEVESATFTSMNGSKLGSPKKDLGISTTVFEPIDAYKGDIARIYFYFVTRYAEDIHKWDNNVFSSDDLGLDPWVIKMFIRWHKNDPVSAKEQKRNEVAEEFQHNRNPFVDHPEFVDRIWGAGTSSKSVQRPVKYQYTITIK